MRNLERYFQCHGRLVARYPATVILATFLLTAICGLGLINFYEESDMTALWVPKGNPQRVNTEWLDKNFPNSLRFNQIIFQADNVLTPEVGFLLKANPTLSRSRIVGLAFKVFFSIYYLPGDTRDVPH